MVDGTNSAIFRPPSTVIGPSMMVHPIPNGDRPKLAHHLHKPRRRRLKHQFAKLRCGRGRIATDALG